MALEGSDDTILETPRQGLGFRLVAEKQSTTDLFAQRFGFARQQIAADPGPQRDERRPRDTVRMIVIAMVVDQKRFKRFEEQPGRSADARCALALFAHDAAQFLKDEIDSGNILAAQHAAFELADQQRPCFRCQLA